MTKQVTIGSIIWGTLRSEDLIPCFVSELERIASDNNDALALINAANLLEMTDDVYDDAETASEIVDDLIFMLNEYAPPHCYFGALEGDGACFGFWPDYEWLNYDDGDTLRVSDLSHIPNDYVGEALLINDHGNASLYLVTNGKPELVWAIV